MFNVIVHFIVCTSRFIVSIAIASAGCGSLEQNQVQNSLNTQNLSHDKKNDGTLQYSMETSTTVHHKQNLNSA